MGTPGVSPPDRKGVKDALTKFGWQQVEEEVGGHKLIDMALEDTLEKGEAKEAIKGLKDWKHDAFIAPSIASAEKMIQKSNWMTAVLFCTKGGLSKFGVAPDIFNQLTQAPDYSGGGIYAFVLKDPYPLGCIGPATMSMAIPEHPWRITNCLRHIGTGYRMGPHVGDPPADWVIPDTPFTENMMVNSRMQISLIMVVQCPEIWYKAQSNMMNTTGRFAVYLNKNLTVVHTETTVFKGVSESFLEKPVVVNTNTRQLFSVLSTPDLKGPTKVLTCTAALFPHVRSFILARTKFMDYDEADAKFHFTSQDAFNADVYHAAVAMTLLGQCYSNGETVVKQVHKRLSSALASKDTTAPTENIFSEWKSSTRFSPGWPSELCVAVAGQVVSTIGTWESKISASSTELCSTSEMAAEHGWDDFTTVLYQAYRLVTEHSHSSTVRFAMMGLTAFETVKEIAPAKMKNEAKNLQDSKEWAIDKPYFSLDSPIPNRFMVANQRMMSVYGLKLHEKNCTGDEKEQFKRYAIAAIAEKLDSQDRQTVDIMVDSSPSFNNSTTADLLAGVNLEIAEKVLASLKPEAAAEVKRLVTESPKDCALKTSLVEQLTRASRARVKATTDARLRDVSSTWTKFYQKQRKTDLSDAERENLNQANEKIKDAIEETNVLFEEQEDDWLYGLSAADLSINTDLLKLIKDRIKEIDGIIIKTITGTDSMDTV